MAAEPLEVRIASLEEQLAATHELLRKLVGLVSQISVEAFLDTSDGYTPQERRQAYEDVREALRAIRATLDDWSKRE